MEPSAAVPWSVLIAVGGTLISTLTGIVLALLSSRLRKLEKQVEDGDRALRDLTLRTTEDRGQILWLKASDAQRKDDYLPRELALQRLGQQDDQLRRIEAALERKVSVRAMPAAHDPREEPPDDSSSLPPMRGRLPSTRGR